VRIHEFSRLNFIYTLLSKRKLTWFADNKYVDGWYDPRFPTVQGVLRRGVTVPALREFILSQGASKRVLDMEWDKFWSTNKKHIDPVAPRYTAIADAGRVRVHLYGEGCPPEAEVRTLGLHPKNADVGSKPVWFGPSLWLEQEDVAAMKEGEEITIMKWGNAIVRKIVRADGGSGAVLSAEAELHLEGDFKKTEKKVTWLAAGGEAVPMLLQDFDYLITVPKLEEGDDFMSVINHKTLVETVAAGEPALRAVPAGAIVQLERKGFFRVDRAASASAPMLLFAIPDGRVKPWGVGSAAHLAEVAAKEKAKGKDEEKVKLKLGKQPKPMANKTAAPPPVSS
jgi:glutamyl-tRNA synthetase